MIIDHLAGHADLLPRIAAWQHAEFGYLTPSTTLDDRLSRLQRSLRRDGLPMGLVALTETRELLGSAAILETTLTHAHLGPWLSSVYVPPAHRGKGVASALARRAITEAARLGHEQLYLFTPRSEALYRRLGWTTFETIAHRGTPLTLMEISVSPGAPAGGGSQDDDRRREAGSG